MNKNISALSILALTIVLSGCAEDRPTIPSGPWEVRATKHSQAKTLGFNDGQLELTGNQKTHLKNLANQAAIPGPIYARIIVNAPVIDEDARKRVDQLSNYLTKLGIDRLRIEVLNVSPVEANSMRKMGSNTITIAIDQYKLCEPNCPGWDEPMNFRTPPEGEKNFGCTTARNLYFMIAEPRDVYQAQQLAEGDGLRNRWPMERLRKDNLKPLIQESYAAGGGGQASAVTVNTGGGSGGSSSGSGY